MKTLPKENFRIMKVENGGLINLKQNNELFTQDENFDPNYAGTLYGYLLSWDQYLGKAILPDTLSGPDICVLFSSIVIFVSIALRADKVDTEKLEKKQ